MPDGAMTDAARAGDAAGTGGFQASLLARAAWVRVAVVALGLVPLWLAIAWAVAVP